MNFSHTHFVVRSLWQTLCQKINPMCVAKAAMVIFFRTTVTLVLPAEERIRIARVAAIFVGARYRTVCRCGCHGALCQRDQPTRRTVGCRKNRRCHKISGVGNRLQPDLMCNECGANRKHSLVVFVVCVILRPV